MKYMKCNMVVNGVKTGEVKKRRTGHVKNR